MGFGSDLQGRASHEALLRLQDTEIRLLENMKKCVTHRIKADRDYTTTLGQMVGIAKKFENNEFQSPVFQAWNTVIHETENVIKLIQDNAEKMCTKTLEKIVQLINEKRAARKSYCDERKRLEDDYSRAQEEVTKCQQEYQRSAEKVHHDKQKYEDLFLRGRGGTKFDECKGKYLKSSTKLHKVHNDYVVSLKEVNVHQDFYLQTTLPAILDYQQTIQQAMVLQCKDVLGEYTQLTDSSSAKFHESFQAMHKCVGSISPTAEYSSFLNQYKSDPLLPTSFDFDPKLLDDYKGSLRPSEVALDNLTLEDLNHCRSSFDDKLAFYRSRKETKEKELAQLQADMAALPSTDVMDDVQKSSYLTQERAVQLLQREIVELNCQQQKYNQLFNMLDLPLKRLGNNDPPPALELHDLQNDKDGAGNMSSSSSGGGAKTKLEGLKNTFVTQMKMPFKKTNSTNVSTPTKVDNDKVLSDDNLPQSTNQKTLPRTGSSASSSGYQQYRMDNRNGTQGSTRGGARRLEDEEWFHGVLPRDEVQRLLKDSGDYLVRESKNKKTGQAQYVLSVMWIDDYKHFIIQGAEGRWRFEGKDYMTIQELISNQHSSGLPVTNKSQAILRKAIVKEEWELNNDDINLGDKLGNGNFGDVFKGVFRSNDVAVKTCRETLSEDQKKTFLQEGRILKQYDHPNIVKFIGIAATRQPVMIVMEYVSGGALLQYLRTHGRQQGVKQLVKMCEDASAGMAYLEANNCIHRDLAARNCLVGKNNMVKISDFGMSREEEEYTVRDGLKQIPIKWTAPEALNYGKYTSLCDVWSFGILVWEIFSCGATPYPGMTNNQARDKIDMGYRMPAPEGTPQNIYQLVLRCWEQQPENRPHFDEIHKELKTIHRQC